MSHLQSNYRGRMYRTIIVFSPILLRALWNIIWAWIDEFVQQKIIICGWYDSQKTIDEYVERSQYEEKFGGTQPDKVDNFFPPKFVDQ